jgi:hypothetical protein
MGVSQNFMPQKADSSSFGYHSRSRRGIGENGKEQPRGQTWMENPENAGEEA